MLEIRGASVQLNDNGGGGLVIGEWPKLAIFGFPASQGSMLTANNNGGYRHHYCDSTADSFGSCSGSGAHTSAPPTMAAAGILSE